ncbi:hypothetical protein, partial [Lactobacillus paragasseri]|uniref:hypothetical protein n=1 Tax=Lactobacillus paragasseri TaxID=2107999 RepID=UPI00189D8504
PLDKNEKLSEDEPLAHDSLYQSTLDNILDHKKNVEFYAQRSFYINEFLQINQVNHTSKSLNHDLR